MTIDSDVFETDFANIQSMPPALALEQLTELYRQSSSQQRARLHRDWQRPLHHGLPDVQKLACKFDGERPSKFRIQMWLTWLCLNARNSDWRDDLYSVCLCYHAARYAGYEEDRLFEEFARLADPPFASLLHEFVQRKEPMKSLETFSMYANSHCRYSLGGDC